MLDSRPTTLAIRTVAAFGALYLALAALGTFLRLDHVAVSPIWLPTGLALAAILRIGPKFAPVITLAACGYLLLVGQPVLVAVGLGLAQGVQALVIARLMNGRGRFSGTLERVHDVAVFVVAGAVVGSCLGAVLQTVFFCSFGSATWSGFFTLAINWWIGDALGVLVVTPVVLAAITRPRWTPDRRALVSGLAITATLLTVGEVTFGRLSASFPLPLAYAVFPVIFWAAFRFGAHGAAVSASFAAIHATAGTFAGYGPFARVVPGETSFLIAAFAAVMVLTGLALGAVISERRAVADALRVSQRRYDLASVAGNAVVWDLDIETQEVYVDPVLKRMLGYEDDEVDNTSIAWENLFHPDDREQVQELSRKHLVGELSHLDVEYRMVTKDRSSRWFLTRGQAQRDPDGRPRRLSGTTVDITRRKQAELLQAGNNEVLKLVAESATLETVTGTIAKNLETITGCRCVLRLLEQDGLRAVSAPSLGDGIPESFRLVPVGQHATSCGQAAFRKAPAHSIDVTEDRSWVDHESIAAELGIGAVWSLPILSTDDAVLGTVALLMEHSREPTRWEIDAATDAAHLARVAIEHVRAQEALTRSESSLRASHEKIQQLAHRLIAGQEQERRRVSLEIHDGLNQQLAALSFEIGRLRSTPSSSPSLNARLTELQSRAASLIEDTRRMSHRLHPSMLEHLGLVAAVRDYCDEISHRGRLVVRFDTIHPLPGIPPEIALCLFRVTQEGVTNASKHSLAEKAQVTLRAAGNEISLTIVDDGRGFDTAAPAGAGLGLMSMAERVHALGGDFTVVSESGEGSRLEVRIPLASAPGERGNGRQHPNADTGRAALGSAARTD